MGKHLAVYVPGLASRTKGWEPLVSRLQSDPEFANTVWMGWDHGRGHFSWTHPRRLAQAMADAVHERWVLDGGYDSVTLIGHSMGGLIVRQAYLLAIGEYANVPRQPWGTATNRIILLGSVQLTV